ncbi:4-hydroxybenzoate octaprenyltransferase [Martelella lutilitoris]|uniref:4-hydroxybenzoate octaprenyltransferase n=1 Tax=Martelella lutilitoris TaxID=2583532 RepID=A0A7T7KLW1_9HYPH|nr:4-hydroxybenzoate octaprenyltransferase [Martelella lutilitoris]QQM31172.1 4-hydroxybenzoate octaprenyltransferase [Martelella lutilitoris]
MGTTTEDNGRVFDAPSDNFVYNLLPRRLWPYAQLARWDRPIGWQLLMWPCFWSAAMAAAVTAEANAFRPGQFIAHLLLFFIGAVAMRGAGCTYNDLVDHDIDNQVARTRSRPLPSGRVTRRQAKIFILLQALTGLAVLLSFNLFTVLLGFASLAFVAIYPFAKRFTDWPQLFLGLAFSWGGLVGWAAVFGSLSLPAVLVYLAAIVWTIGYDTIYAHQDKEDDALIGVRSTARLFGERTKPWLILFYGAMLTLLVVAYLVAGLGWAAFAGLLAAGAMLFYQIAVLDIDDGAQCLKLFKFNSRVGLVVFLGLVAAIFIG